MVFVDGFNLYHALDNHCKAIKKTTGINANYLKWLDLKSLSQALITKNEVIAAVNYYSAYAMWRGTDSHNRHRSYVTALEYSGVSTRLGKFKERDVTCKNCNTSWKKHEEKATDVNIAINIIKSAFKNEFDRAIIVSADTDLIPAIRLVKQEFPNLEVDLCVPIGHTGAIAEFKTIANQVIKLKPFHISNNRLPNEFKTSKGITLTVPDDYKSSI